MGYIGKVPADVLIDPMVDSAAITDATIVTADLANDAVTSAKLAANSVDSSELIDGSVDNAHLAGSIAMNKTNLTAGTGLTLSTDTLNVDAAQTQITSVGTIGTGVWNGTAIASSYLDSDTAHLSGTQTFSGEKTFSADVTLSGAKLLVAASAQGIFGAADGDTGIRWEGSNALAFDTNGSERMLIEADGTVVIPGALQPAGNVTIGGKTTIENDAAEHLTLKRDSSHWWDMQVSSNGNLNIQKNGAADTIVVEADGDVKITERLTVGSWDDSNTHGHAYIDISSDANEGADSCLYFGAGTTVKGSIYYNHHATASSQSMYFKTGDNATTSMILSNSMLNLYNNDTGSAGSTLKQLSLGKSDSTYWDTTSTGTFTGLAISNAHGDAGTACGIQFSHHASSSGVSYIVSRAERAYNSGGDRSSLHFGTRGSDWVQRRMIIGDDGVITTTGDFKPGADIIMANARGINFATYGSDGSGSGVSLDSEILDDYEEGTWEPTLVPASNSYTSITYQTDTGGRYTKIGNLVHVQGCVRYDSITIGSASGALKIGNFPFTSRGRTNGDNDDAPFIIFGTGDWDTGRVPAIGYRGVENTTGGIYYYGDAGEAPTAVDVTHQGTGGSYVRMHFTCTYHAAL